MSGDRCGIIAAHPTGNANVRQAVGALAEAGLLTSFETAIAVFDGSPLGVLSRLPGFSELQRRGYGKELGPFTRMHPWREVARLASMRLGFQAAIRDWTGFACIDAVYQSIGRRTARRLEKTGAAGVYCYEDGALEAFQAGKRLGAACLYDLPIGYWRAAHRILSEEAGRRPEWAATMPGLGDPPEKLERKDSELRLADRIFVASSFTKKTLGECPFPIADACVVPYGADDVVRGERPHPRGHGGKLRVLFVGSLGQRKGIADLFEAVSMLGPAIELTLVGRKAGGPCPALDAELSRHRWIPSLPRERILAEMRAHDVLVFPSLFEGFGLVVVEALSQGLPVVGTPHTCAPDILSEGIDGFVVPIRDPQAIAGKLECLRADPVLLAEMKNAAAQKARLLPWAAYRKRIVEGVRGALCRG